MTNRTAPLLVAAGLVATLLAGCTVTFDGGGKGGSFARHVAVVLGGGSFAAEPDPSRPEAFLADAVATSFVYTHDGADLEVAGAEVTYTNEAGRERTVGLDRLTGLTTLQEGDSFTVGDAAVTSGIVLEKGGDVVASRQGSGADWLRVSGYPLPLDPRAGSSARWRVDSSLDVEASFDRLSFSEEDFEYNETCQPRLPPPSPPSCTYEERVLHVERRIDGFTLDAGFAIDAEVGVAATGAQVVLDGEGGASGQLLVDFHLTETETDQDGHAETVSHQAGADAAIELGFGGELAGTLAGDRELETVTSSGHARGDGHVHVWDGEHARDARHEPPGLTHPFFDLSGSKTQDVGSPVGHFPGVASFLERLWGMGLEPGDEFLLETDPDAFPFPISWSQSMKVSGPEEIHLAGRAFHALRIDSTLAVDGGRGALAMRGIDLDLGTVWLEEGSYLPLRADLSASLEFDEEDLAPVLAMAAMFLGGDFTAPSDLRFALQAEGTLELTSLDGEIQGSAALVAAPFLLAPLALAFGAFAGLGGGFDDVQEEAAPDISFALDRAEGRLTVIHTTDHDLAWDELQVEGCAEVPTGPVEAADEARGCEGTVRVIHLPTNTLLYEGSA